MVALLACVMVGTLDEWFQWFVPIRAGELRDIQLDLAAGVCGLLFGAAIDPPAPLTRLLAPSAAAPVGASAMAAVLLLTLFVLTVHMGYAVRDAEIGEFRSRYSGPALLALASDREAAWSSVPPVALRRYSREDQYLAEGIWRVRRRNDAWEAGDLAAARRENLILEKYYAPVLDTPTYLGPSGHRWPDEQRAAAEVGGASGQDPRSIVDDYAYPLLVWPFGG
jgi:hypothetical protein